MPDMRPLYDKFAVTRNDGKDQPGEKHHGCDYFVLDIKHDKYARDALAMYSAVCATERPELAKSIAHWLKTDEWNMETPDA